MINRFLLSSLIALSLSLIPAVAQDQSASNSTNPPTAPAPLQIQDNAQPGATSAPSLFSTSPAVAPASNAPAPAPVDTTAAASNQTSNATTPADPLAPAANSGVGSPGQNPPQSDPNSLIPPSIEPSQPSPINSAGNEEKQRQDQKAKYYAAKVKADKEGKKIAASAIWAPELHYFKNTYWIAYCVNYGGTGILKSESGKPEGPYVDVKKDGPLTSEIDASLFDDENGSVYFVWQNGKIAKMKEDLSGLAEEPRHLKPANANHVGFEAAFITKINGRYHLICADFMKWDGKTATYDCMAASSENIYGPYGDRYLAVPGGGHNVLFKDAEGKWWSTYFGNDSKAPFRERPAILRIEIDKDNRIKPVGE